MSALRLVMGDQLSRSLASLRDADPARDVILMVEAAEEARHIKHHKQKIAMIFAAMRHFAEGLREEGFTLVYSKFDDPLNTGSFEGEIARALGQGGFSRLIITEPSEWRVADKFDALALLLPITLERREDDRFFCSRDRFAEWAKGRKSFRMEFFYRAMRQESGFLMENGAPAGGAWNFDVENRKPWPRGAPAPERLRFEPDEVTREVIALVERCFPDHFGETAEFGWPVTRAQALEALDDFIRRHLPGFGDTQDAMKADAPFLRHSLIAPALNIGLLEPREICERAQEAWRCGDAPLASVEGFIRQILGWREYVRGLYWRDRDYGASNALNAYEELPAFFWTGQTPMFCLSQSIGQTQSHAYAHHIQRLMVIGNFALLAGLNPQAVQNWFHIVYADAFEWVELPNVQGMALHADGGLMASKPYAASGAYIDRMSDYCGRCQFKVKQKIGEQACPFNALYWGFLERNKKRLAGNPRMALPYRRLASLSEAELADIRAESEAALARAMAPLAQSSLGL